MPSVSKDTAPTKVTWEGVDIDHADLEGGYAVLLREAQRRR
jgi:hypothetical protein